MSEDYQDATETSHSVLWIFLLVPICVIAAIFAYYQGLHSRGDMALLSGEFFAYAVFSGGIFHSLLLRDRGAKLFGMVFAAIFVCLLIGGYLGVGKQKRQAALVFSSAQQELKRLGDALEISKAGSSASTSGIIETRTGEPTKATGEFGEMERFMKDFMNSAVGQRNDYLRELDAAGWNKLLDAARLKNDVSMRESRNIIEQGKNIVSKYEKKTATLFEDGKEKINALNVTEETKKDIFAGFERGMVKSSQQLNEQWQMEKQIVQEVENIVTLLSDRTKWIVDGGQITFYGAEDLERFNAHNQKIERIAHQQEEMQKRRLEESKKNFEKLTNTAEQ
ncbi:hypothetical protein [Undibacterium sp. Ji49W]|uniref:hypothetical protein n=1 Tax=Undibacterium sp. Ji49W TaxID=3413040 RepID=UPI003BF33DE2